MRGSDSLCYRRCASALHKRKHIRNEKIAKALRETVDFRPAAIISYFGLRKPIFAPLSAYGHFGREELGVRFEKTDIADIIADKLGLKI